MPSLRCFLLHTWAKHSGVVGCQEVSLDGSKMAQEEPFRTANEMVRRWKGANYETGSVSRIGTWAFDGHGKMGRTSVCKWKPYGVTGMLRPPYLNCECYVTGNPETRLIIAGLKLRMIWIMMVNGYLFSLGSQTFLSNKELDWYS